MSTDTTITLLILTNISLGVLFCGYRFIANVQRSTIRIQNETIRIMESTDQTKDETIESYRQALNHENETFAQVLAVVQNMNPMTQARSN